jgi:hypothetical protein
MDAGQGAKKRRFAGVGVSDQDDRGHGSVLPKQQQQ